jgi:hypothetical protein
MASPLDYFTPGEMPNAQPDQNIMPSIAAFMNNPQALNALLAFGTQAMIPQWGGGAVQFAKGVGAAGEAASAQEASSQKQQEIESKAGLREAQAGAAEARANTAATRASLTGQVEEGKRERALTMNKVRLTNMHNNYMRGIAIDNANIRKQNDAVRFLDPKAPQVPEKTSMPIDEWVMKNPLIKELGLMPPTAPAAAGGGEDDIIPSNAAPDAATVPTAAAPAKQVGMTQVVKSGPYAGKEVQWDGSQWKLTGK